MSWIALKMLVGDRAKFLGIVLGLTFAALLIMQQGSIFCGLMLRTAGQIDDITGADLWVMDPNVLYIDDGKPMLESSLYRVRGVEGVLWAVPLYKGNGRAKHTIFKPDDQYQLKLIPSVKDVGQIPTVARDTYLIARVNGDLYFRIFDGMGKVAVSLDEKRLPRKAGQVAELRKQLEGLWEVKAPTDSQKRAVISAMKSVLAYSPQGMQVNESVILLGLEDISLVGAPKVVLAGSYDDLRGPDAVMVDRVGLRKLVPGEGWDQLDADPNSETWTTLRKTGRYYHPKLKKWFELSHVVGCQLEMNDRRAVIVGICESTRTFQSNAVVYTTYTRAKQFIPQERKPLTFILAKAASDDPAVRARVAAAITTETGLLAKTSAEFSWDTIEYFLKYTGIPINFGITTVLGFLVGTAIAGQTFYNFTLENLKQFGSLKAMGATNLRIVGMILLQATVVGMLGYGLGVGLASLFGQSVKGQELAFYTPWQLLPLTGVAIVLICILSSLLSIRRVIVLEPAVVFRG